MGFIFHFYIVFGTNLLTGGPAQNCYFFAFFSISKKQNIKRNETFGSAIFSSDKTQETWTLRQESHEAVTRVEGAPPYLVGPLDALRRQLQLYIFAFGEKKSERRNHHILRYGAAAKP